MNNSTSSTSSFGSQSSTNSPEYETWLKESTKPKTPAQIKANGDVKTRLGILVFLGVICVSLIIFAGVFSLRNPENTKDIWVIIGPMISSAITGTVAFFYGENTRSSK